MTVVDQIEMKSKLEQLRDQAGRLVAPNFETERGKEWFPRLEASMKYREEKLHDSDTLRAFFAKPYEEIEISLPDGGTTTIRIKLSIAWSMGKNHVSDLHARNPEPWIRTRRGREDREFDRMISDVAVAIHDNANSEDVTRKCLITGLYQGGGISYWGFDQDGTWEMGPVVDEAGIPKTDDAGKPVQAKRFVATSQRVVNKFVPLSQCLLDPDARAWDFADARWFGWQYKLSLQDAWENETHFDKEGRKLLVNAVGDSNSKLASDGRDKGTETDPRFIDIEIIEVWDRTTHTIAHHPIIDGKIAKFHIGEYSWPRALKQADKLPFRLVAEDWLPPNMKDDDGIYPPPLLRHAKALIEDIIRLYELFFEAAGSVVDKWVTYEGLLKSDNFVNIMSQDRHELTLLDPAATTRLMGGQPGSLPNPANVIQRLDRGNDKLAQAAGFANMIQAAKNELYEVFGQGGAERGGISEGSTATEIAAMANAREQRNRDASEEVAKAYDWGTEIAFLLVAEHQTLPIPYQLTTSAYGEKRWAEFEADLLLGLDLVYSHVTGSSRPKNRAQDRQERRDFISAYLPFVQSKRQISKLGRWAADAHDTTGLNLTEVFEDPAPEIAKQLLALQTAIQDNPEMAADPEVAAEMANLQTQLVEAVLSQADIEEVATGQEGSGGGSGGASRGAGPKSMTPGQMAAAGAAAGMTNVGAA